MVANAKHLETMVRPMGRVEGTGWLVRPSEVRHKARKERRRQSGHLGGEEVQDFEWNSA